MKNHSWPYSTANSDFFSYCFLFFTAFKWISTRWIIINKAGIMFQPRRSDCLTQLYACRPKGGGVDVCSVRCGHCALVTLNARTGSFPPLACQVLSASPRRVIKADTWQPTFRSEASARLEAVGLMSDSIIPTFKMTLASAYTAITDAWFLSARNIPANQFPSRHRSLWQALRKERSHLQSAGRRPLLL